MSPSPADGVGAKPGNASAHADKLRSQSAYWSTASAEVGAASPLMIEEPYCSGSQGACCAGAGLELARGVVIAQALQVGGGQRPWSGLPTPC